MYLFPQCWQEEISHCAAGVRWLKHLHKVARSQQQLEQAAAGAVAGAVGSTPQQQQQQQQQQSEALDGSSAGAKAAAAAADWAVEAAKYESVEEWFHSLIRSHFKGSLKV
jgi:kynureninase